METEAFKMNVDGQGVARLVFDLPEEKVNKFSYPVMKEFLDTLDAVSKQADIKVLLLMSGKPGIFIAGADIGELAKIKDEGEGESKARFGQAVFSRLENLPFPTVAVIDGAGVGGGLECALACQYRLVSDSPKCKLGLPEVTLGIIPGWGGTQRLPRLLGLPQALDLILSGRSIDGKKAVRIGLADRLMAHEFVEDAVQDFVKELLLNSSMDRRTTRKGSVRDRFLSGTPLGRWLVYRKARQNLERRTKGKYPAPEAALEVVRETFVRGGAAGFAREAKVFAKLCSTHVSKNLVQLFYTNESLKKDAGIGDTLHPEPIRSAAVLGAGVMGGGIAWLLSSQDIPVRMKDIKWEAIAAGYAEANSYYQQMVKRRKMRPHELNVKMHRISGTVDYTGFRKVDLVIEAVVEDLEVKRSVLRDVEKRIPVNAVIATNTSSLSLVDLGEGLVHPERLVGMHFFNPVNRMPLVEVIAGPKTAQEAIAKVIDLTRRLGKTPIVVNNCSGFLVNRILIPYLNESAYMLQEGTSMERIDKVLEDFGLPMGPFALADEVGIDVGLKVALILEKAYGKRMRVADIMKAVYEEGHLLGKKDGKGFYLHKGKERTPNDKTISELAKAVQERLHTDHHDLDTDEIVDRALLCMVNEAARCLEEDIVHTPEYLDMAMIMGTGFPPFRGGPLRYADERGLSDVCRALEALQKKFGERYEPSGLLLEMERSGRRFYETA
ncbi:3-hydroxyacyl-CoA dehydrogenase NAD-binding domain-containing protein [Pelagicoccus sp. SDUM812005]|uniref:3-hydroxyacyl-CoA dehydrogenase NAD-binding domain-containing protein n=1 Tax=Pelagicoccus sp. SDUM812005 TaxID=3041257 RepID=UPI00280F0F1A|nr:3-hydroxyacyl-CoA dehydrogenase NAD-binding domain-containing protein [Pelagicoccus sp. SDUM812005]MDQ8179174.1 3-hydroxyacyl-CoA dehydrogenase NAD-binding domain-containing protein [Pelagicoccus sp. SDUM812005]